MRIKKNGKVVNLTESDLQRIVKKVLNEEPSGCGTYTGTTLLEKFKCCAYKINKDTKSLDKLDKIKTMKQAAEFIVDNGIKYSKCMGGGKKSY